jgi:hypothetical protein
MISMMMVMIKVLASMVPNYIQKYLEERSRALQGSNPSGMETTLPSVGRS